MQKTRRSEENQLIKLQLQKITSGLMLRTRGDQNKDTGRKGEKILFKRAQCCLRDGAEMRG